jgi:Circadian oscillating protein COP23
MIEVSLPKVINTYLNLNWRILMNKQLVFLLAGALLLANAMALKPVLAESEQVSFYCGQSYDPLSKRNIPTTWARVPGRLEPFALIRWKSEFFPNFSPQKRCDVVSPKFQAAYGAGKLQYLSTGKHERTGQGIICGLANLDDVCEKDADLLFTLKPYVSSEIALNQLVGILNGTSNDPIFQGSNEQIVVDLKNFLPFKK